MTKRYSAHIYIFLLCVFNRGLIADLYALDVHPQGMPCNKCHLVRGVINQQNAKTLVATQEVLCKGCHQNAITASHPTGLKPSKKPPASFPLDWKGELTCSTCHSIHSTEPGLPRVNLIGKPLCLSCHTKNFFARMKDGGTSLLLSGHLDPRASLQGNIDSFSIQCMSCHDTLVENLNVQISTNVLQHNSDNSAHPIGMQYRDSVNYGGYHPAALLPKEISLPDGKISCISCHLGYSDLHGKLVMDNTGEKLCYSCHDM
ncbi:MAG: cytochrome c3 family protein [Gammaproteobacteria bacterium]|nr:cytochrome c3 family protein [Gammaproteobacteria bacterium]